MPDSSFFHPPASVGAGLPLVTIVALCHNHAPFLREALDSIVAQTYPALEVWLVDDASTDNSPVLLREYAASNPGWQLRLLPENVGNCRAFNLALRASQGAFIIDFATDDVLLPGRVAAQVAAFQRAEASVGMVYSNAELIDEAGHSLGLHHQPDSRGNLRPVPASGWLLAEVLRRYFISTPTMMMRRACLESLGGYDETLAYEDFDFWVRASREWQFLYLDEITTRKRKHPRSMSARAYRRHDPYLASTIRVCEKALALVRTPAERAALAVRLRSELRQA
ncbi:MAG: glycosyltransferase, partial [Bacteroidota bacterium]|nr:glycosyltransferase [Bacteroidota bacterium]